MPYGQIKVDQVTFTNAGADQTISVSGIVASISGNITATGTISGNVIRGGTLVSGATVTGTAGQFGTITGNTAGFTTVTGTTVTGTTANFVSGVFSGNSTAAAFIPTGSTVPTNGIYLPSANNVAISTNGSGRLFVDSIGNVGVGIASPSALLEVNGKTIVGSTSNNALEVFSNGDTEIGFSYSTKGNIYAKIIGDITQASPLGGEIAFQTATGGSLFERVRIDSSGRLGVGTSSPGATLHVEGLGNTVNQYIFTSDNVSNATASLTFGTTPGSRSKAAIQMVNTNTGNAAGALSLLTNDNAGLVSRLYIDSAGKVGVGSTSDPGSFGSRLWIDTTGDTYFTVNSTGSTNLSGIHFRNSNSNGEARFVNNTGGATTFYRNPTTEAARIDTSGRLLVGTSSSNGVNSNTAPVLAGNFVSFTGSVSANSGTATTLFSLENLNATYMITAVITGTANSGAYHAVYIVGSVASNSHSIQALKAGSLLTLSLSGANVQATQSSGVSQTITWSVTRMANL